MPSTPLPSSLHQRLTSLKVHEVRGKAGKLHLANLDIASQFQEFHYSLYNIPPSAAQESNRTSRIREFLIVHCPPPFAAEIALSLESPLSPEEMLLALKQMKPGKISGRDGLSTQYYRSFSSHLLPHFLRVFNSDSVCSTHSPQLLEGHVMVFPKGDKDPSLVAKCGRQVVCQGLGESLITASA